MGKKSRSLIMMTMILMALILVSFSSQSKAENSTRSTNISGKIDPEVFYNSIPRQMIVGKSYEVMVFVRNTGEKDGYYMVSLVAPGKFIYPQYSSEQAMLSSGESRRYKFLITPINEHTGEINVTAKLIPLPPRENIEFDSITATVFCIKQAYQTADMLNVGVTILVMFFILTFFYILRS
jgi:hypothetical protein